MLADDGNANTDVVKVRLQMQAVQGGPLLGLVSFLFSMYVVIIIPGMKLLLPALLAPNRRNDHRQLNKIATAA